MRQYDHCERITTVLKLRQSSAIVEQFGRGEGERDSTAPELLREQARVPLRMIVAQNRQAGDGPMIPVEQAIVVDEHSLGEVGRLLALDLEMDQHPALIAS